MHENQNTELTTVLVLSTFIYHNDLYLRFFFLSLQFDSTYQNVSKWVQRKFKSVFEVIEKIPVMIKMNRHYFFHQEKARFCFGLLLQFQIVIAK